MRNWYMFTLLLFHLAHSNLYFVFMRLNRFHQVLNKRFVFLVSYCKYTKIYFNKEIFFKLFYIFQFKHLKYQRSHNHWWLLALYLIEK